MVLVLDNASYHHSGRQFFEKTATKINMYSSMDKFNIEEINVPRLGTIRRIAQSDGGEKKMHYGYEGKTFNRYPDGPSREELLLAMKTELPKSMFQSNIENIFEEQGW